MTRYGGNVAIECGLSDQSHISRCSGRPGDKPNKMAPVLFVADELGAELDYRANVAPFPHAKSCPSAAFASEVSPKADSTPAARTLTRREAIRQRLHENHERILLWVREVQPAHSFGVHIGGRLRLRPARNTLARIIWSAARQHVTRVVEMHDGLQAGEVSIVSVRLYESGERPLVDVA